MRANANLSTKIFFLAFLNLLLLGLVFLVFMRFQFRLSVGSFLLSPSEDRILSISRQLALDLRETDPSQWNELLQRYANEHHVELRLIDGHGTLVAGLSTPAPASVLAMLGPDDHSRHRDEPLSFLGTTDNPRRYWVAIHVPIPTPAEYHSRHGSLLASSDSFSRNLFFFDPKPWIAVVLAVILISVICWLPLVRGLTRSISRVTRATAAIAEGNFEARLPVTRGDELGRLSNSINTMSARLDGFVKGQKRFLGDTAHELCSPLARMQVAVGILERSSASEQKKTVIDLQDDVEQMATLVNDVLAFSKAGLRRAETPLEKIRVADIVERVVGREGNGAAITTNVQPDLTVLADRDLLVRALSNILRNAIRYAGAAGPIEISSEERNDIGIIRVSDCGPGIADKDLTAVFEPFYRPESARTRETGGVGLGLAIVKTCVEACRGTVCCRNKSPKGLEVEIELCSAHTGHTPRSSSA